MPRRSIAQIALVAIAGAFLLACPNKRKVASPEPPVPRDGDQAALRRFEEARAQFHQGKAETAATTTAEFEAIAREFPDDPIVPHALLAAAKSAFAAKDHAKVVAVVDELAEQVDVDPRLLDNGRLYRGLARNYKGEHQAALGDLRIGEKALAPDGELRIEWTAAMATALAATGEMAEALHHYDTWHRIGRASEKAYIETMIEKAAQSLPDKQVHEAFGAITDWNGPSAAHLGVRMAGIYRSAGETANADKVDGKTEKARKRFGLVISISGNAASGDAGRVGGLLPLTGKGNRIGDASARGMSFAASFGKSGGASGWPKPFSLQIRDSSTQADTTAALLAELDSNDVIAVLGPVDRRVAAVAESAATKLALPLVTLSQRPTASSSKYVFHIAHSAEMRARALARYAIKNGVKDFAVMKPKNGYGQAVGHAFADEVEAQGGHVIVTVTYSSATTSFRDPIRKLKKPWKGLFIADSAKRLELIAPALAAGMFRSRPLKDGKLKKPRGMRGRPIFLMSTAENLDDRFIANAARHSEGAVFAPGFYADSRDARISDFVSEYQGAFGRVPTAFAAYAFDAALVVRKVVEAGARNRGEVAADLAQGKFKGLTGTIQFDASHLRADDGVLFELRELSSTTGSTGFAIRAIR